MDKVIDFFWKNISLKNGENVIGFSGNLGAGKTTFIKYLLKSLGVEQNVISPTFVLRRDYDLRGASRPANVIHIDAYRLEDPNHIYQVISKEELENKNNLILIEWPEKIDKNLFNKIFLFEHIDEETRKISCLI